MKSTTHQPEDQVTQDAVSLLRRIGWDPSEWSQIEVYARMSPARKVAQMFEVRQQFMSLLRSRLRAEHPSCSDAELARMVQEHLDLVRENHIYEWRS